MVRVSLYPFKLNIAENLKYSGQLVSAARSNPLLARELPAEAQGYSTRLRAATRLARIVHSGSSDDLLPFLIMENNSALGVIAARRGRPNPDLLAPSHADAFELSYWHDRTDLEAVRDIGKQAIQQIIPKIKPDAYSSEQLWMVTLPNDVVKTAVMRELHFTDEAQEVFDLQDGVTEVRTLWTQA